MKKIMLSVLIAVVALFFTGCAGSVKNMTPLAPSQVVTVPAQDKAMVIFMRPSSMGYAIQSSVFDIQNNTPKLVGIVAAKKKVAYQVDAGEHLFMVVGESADFMSATLESNKTYYALVTPRMGMWKARFSLKPVSSNELMTAEFNEWLNDCEWVGKTLESDNWEQSNFTDIHSKYTSYYKDWMSKDASDRPKLMGYDGK